MIAEIPKQIDFEAAAARIARAKRVLVTTHARADGDAVGSALSMARIIRSLGKEATVYFHEPIPPRYVDLPNAATARVWPTNSPVAPVGVAPANSRCHTDDALAWADLALVVDTCATAQLESVAAALGKFNGPKLAIDHHVTRDPIVDEILLDTGAGSCTQIITSLCDAAGWIIDADIATLLFAGLATDTGWFRFSNADAAVYKTASRLIDAGARPNELNERLYNAEPEARVRLMGAVMSSFELRAGGRLAVVRITGDMLRRCGANSKMTEEVINETHRVGTVVASAMFVEPESPEEPVRVSLRSKRDINVAAIARKFGGGGHERAAGLKVREAFSEVVQRVVAAMEQELS
ncbi:MAG: bifunctional oligoribonuclease/PAP phosphatase NrnA [Planctomycetes bacterium]|nr:bifunctional oligoribonuclease/PAP phosphatase NrnA [Planctomycetota bacterium]